MTQSASSFFVGLGWDPDSVYNEIPTYSDELLQELEHEIQVPETQMSEHGKMLLNAALSWVREEIGRRKNGAPKTG